MVIQFYGGHEKGPNTWLFHCALCIVVVKKAAYTTLKSELATLSRQ